MVGKLLLVLHRFFFARYLLEIGIPARSIEVQSGASRPQQECAQISFLAIVGNYCCPGVRANVLRGETPAGTVACC